MGLQTWPPSKPPLSSMACLDVETPSICRGKFKSGAFSFSCVTYMHFIVLFEYLRKVNSSFWLLLIFTDAGSSGGGGCSDVDGALTGNDRATAKLITVIHAKHHSYRRDYCLLMDNKSKLLYKGCQRDLGENTHHFLRLCLCWHSVERLLWFSVTWFKHEFTPVMWVHTMSFIQMKCNTQVCCWSRFWSLFLIFNLQARSNVDSF